jgi:hypothetical protein
MNVKPEPKLYFKVANGQIIKNVLELPEAIDGLDAITFNSHVTPFRNDFAKWVFDVFMLSDLSKKLGEVKTKEETIRILRAYIRQTLLRNEDNIQNNINQSNSHPSNSSPENTATPAATSQTPIPAKNAQESVQKPQEPPRIAQSSQPKPAGRVYVWKTTQSVPLVLPQQSKPEKKQEKKEETKPEEKKEDVRQEKPEPKPAETPESKLPVTNISDADEFFEKNPVLVSHIIDAKKRTMEIEPLFYVEYSESQPVEKASESFKDSYAKVHERIIFLRKSGFDTALADIMLHRIPSKIKVFEASKEAKDAVVVKRYLNEVIEELNNLKT